VVDQHGVVLDILVQEQWNATAAKHFFKRLLHGLQYKQADAPARSANAAVQVSGAGASVPLGHAMISPLSSAPPADVGRSAPACARHRLSGLAA
jgi:hypothetical protein